MSINKRKRVWSAYPDDKHSAVNGAWQMSASLSYPALTSAVPDVDQRRSKSSAPLKPVRLQGWEEGFIPAGKMKAHSCRVASEMVELQAAPITPKTQTRTPSYPEACSRTTHVLDSSLRLSICGSLKIQSGIGSCLRSGLLPSRPRSRCYSAPSRSVH